MDHHTAPVVRTTSRNGATRRRAGTDRLRRIGPPPLPWQPVRPELTLFMTNATTCPMCVLTRQAAGLPRDEHLHVQLGNGTLTITQIDDIHEPGKRLIATYIASFGSTQLFRLDGVQDECDRSGHAAGIVTLGWVDGQRWLRVAGLADGFKAHGQVIIDAREADAT